MFRIQIKGDLTPLIAGFDRMIEGLGDILPLANDIRQIMIDDNVIARTAGVDRDSDPLVPLAPIRRRGYLTAGEIRRRGGDGPPLAPKGAASRVVAGFETEVVALSDHVALVLGGWPSMPFMVFHADGRGHNPVRDVVGMRPETEPALRAATRAFVESRMGVV